MNPANNPRSILHALEPIGVGSPALESLMSYFCRLAVSHSVSLVSLAREVASKLESELRDDFVWHERNLSGLGASALSWSGALSALTSVERLDRLTLLTWQDVLSAKGIAHRTPHWCPQCLAEDRGSGKSPYFRLLWDVAAVTACHEHRVELRSACPHCGRSKTRHSAAYVVPGWCTHCGGFLGDINADQLVPASSDALWNSRQVGLLLEKQAALATPPGQGRFREALREIITQMDGGQGTRFARRIGLAKTTVHHWLKDDGIPTLHCALKIAAHTGLTLPDLLMGNLDGWSPPAPVAQMVLALNDSARQRRATPREHDWEDIRTKLVAFSRLPTPISVAEAARRLDLNSRHLYLQANRESRILGERWMRFVSRRREINMARVRPILKAACLEILREGRAISLREVEARVPHQDLASVESIFELLREIQAELMLT